MSAGALAVALVLGLLAPGLVAEAQPAAKPYRIGWLDPSPADFRDWRETFLAELTRRGGASGPGYVLINLKTASALGITLPPTLPVWAELLD